MRGYIIPNFITVLICIVNILVRNVMYNLLRFIEYETNSGQVNEIMKNILITVVINTGFLSLFIYANFEFTPIL